MMENSIPPKVLLSAGMIQSGHSGVGRYVVELAKRMGNMEAIDLHMVGLDADRHLFPSFDDDHWLSIPDAFASGAKNLLWHQAYLPGVLRRHKFDLFHAPSYRRILAACPVPQMATIHDCAPFRLREKYGVLRGFFGRQVAPRLAKRCEHILTVSEFTKQDLVRFFKLPAAKVEVIYNGLSHNAFRPRAEDEIYQFRERQKATKPFFLYISRLEHPAKNHVRLIEAFESFRQQTNSEMELVLGGAPWHGAEVIKECIAQSAFSHAIKLPGFIEDVDLPLWYAACEAMVFPSLFEGFGLPVIEALASGVRVLSSDRGSLLEIGGDAALFFNPEDASAISSAMIMLHLENSIERKNRVQKGIEHASKFAWDKAALATSACYLQHTAPTPSTE